MNETNKPRLPTQYARTDLAWAEELLGESLGQLPDQEPAYGKVTPGSDASVIPHGEYCYDSEAEGHVPCPHYLYTKHGSIKCNYLGYEAFNDGSEVATHKLLIRFKSVDEALKAGVVYDDLFTDSYKVCGVHTQAPGRAEWLESLIQQYRAEVESQPGIAVPTADKPAWDFKPMTEWMICTAWTRLELWEYMTGMVEDIPPRLIHELMVADKRFRVKTYPAHELLDPDFAKRMPPHDSPQRQYWYMYRKNLGNPLQHEALHDPIGFYPPPMPQGK